MALTKNSKQLVKEANAKIQTLSLDEAKEKLGNVDVQFIDIRDVRELEREGTILGRCMHQEACWNSGLTLKAHISNLSLLKTNNLFFTANLVGALR